MNKEEHSFEQAYARLEEIMQKLNTSQTSLEDSITLYEEADHLIKACNKKLVNAEQKVQKLIKTRDASVATTPEGAPQMEPFNPVQEQYINRNIPS
ncbi:exodeoxyribonuclease VII small subunit [Candidatus Aerophobetes bacterium]|uniref:Exodeoxyribonuclease 7 small subunit n=1 Tax=Aerophobetes bacterium TaxID=2030807 RepID=A0A2A4YLE1_UNCAE|nr:MAG: exodeoxyribonuclease VII small subunit [Candidatus Aerophobetes bacterium]